MENLKSRKHSKRATDNIDSAQKHRCGTIVERYLADERYQKRMHAQGYTQTDIDEFDGIALERKNYAATREERRYYRDPRSCNPIKEEAPP